MQHFLNHAKRLFTGGPVRSESAGHQLLPKRLALPVFASDALSSVAYAPDEILLALALAGSLALVQSFWVGVAVTAVLAVVVLSYRQTVRAYPSGGGDYEVVTTNLGPTWGLVVASALLVDYVLTVAVSLSAGAHYLIAAVPALVGLEVPIAVAAIAVLTLVHLRGLKEAGAALAVPTYLYMGAIALMVVVGLFQLFTGHLDDAPSAAFDLVPAPDHVDGLVGLGGAFLLMRAFSSGCAALTGVEAIPNGVPSFQRPKSRNAATALAMIGGIAVAMMLSVLVLAHVAGVKVVEDPATQLTLNGAAVPEGTVLAPVIGQLAAAVFGQGSPLFLLVAVATGLVLVLAANTAFNGFPTLVQVLSKDAFLPRQLHRRGDRLAHPFGIIVLAAVAIILVVAFDAQVTRLIQLYVVSVFVSFTLSQLGMIRHWNRLLRSPQTGSERAKVLRSRSLNVIGFMATGVVLVVALVTKLGRGAWITLALMAVAFVVLRLIRHHYDSIGKDLQVEDWSAMRALPSRVHALVLVSDLSKPSMRAVATARAGSPSSLEVVSVVFEAAEEARIRREWERSGLPIPLTLLSSPYRDVAPAVVQYVRALRRRAPSEMLVVHIPQFLVRHWWEKALHNQTAAAMCRALLGVPGVVITSVPWKLGEDDGAEGGQLVNDPFRPASLQAPPVAEDTSDDSEETR